MSKSAIEMVMGLKGVTQLDEETRRAIYDKMREEAAARVKHYEAECLQMREEAAARDKKYDAMCAERADLRRRIDNFKDSEQDE